MNKPEDGDTVACDVVRAESGGRVEVHRMQGVKTVDLLMCDGEDAALVGLSPSEARALGSALFRHANAVETGT